MKISFFKLFLLNILPVFLLSIEPPDIEPFNYTKDGGWEYISWRDDIEPCCYTPLAYRPWGIAEYVIWSMRTSPKSIPLVTQGPVVPNLTPTLGQPGTTVVLGASTFKVRSSPGARFAFGCWLDDCQVWGTEIEYLFSEKKKFIHKVSSSGQEGSPFLAFPFFDVVTGKESSSSIALPGAFSGKAVLKSTTHMQGAEWNGIYKMSGDDASYSIVFTGLRYWNLNETFTFRTNSPNINPPKETFKTEDQFKTFNQFYGWELGLKTVLFWNDFFCKIKGKIACGVMRENLKIKGELKTNNFNNFGADQTFPAGYLGMPTNNGSETRNEFGAVSESNIAIGYQLFGHLNIEIGYSFIFVNSVMRANNQASRRLNTSQAPAITNIPTTTVTGVAKPIPLFKTASFWAQGLSAALEFTF